MRKTLSVVLAAALAGGLATAGGATGGPAWPDGVTRAVRATDTYSGAFKRVGPGTRVKIKVRTRDGEAKSIRSLRYRRLPATCEVSGARLVNDGWRFTRFRVNPQRRFSIAGQAKDGSTVSFTGRFSKRFNKVKGQFQSSVEFPEPERETCETLIAAYAARR